MSLVNLELESKILALRGLLEKHHADAILLRNVSSFAWATCGAASYVNTAVTEGAASLVITQEKMFLATNNIEAPRLEQEEDLPAQGWEFVISPWESPLQGLHKLVESKRLVSDVPFSGAMNISPEIARLRTHLTAQEGDRIRHLGRLCAETIHAAAQAVLPGMREYELAALLGGEAQNRGIQPIVNLVATDERAYRYRHPLPTDKKLEKYALLVLSGRQRGLVCSISRLVHFGKLPSELDRRIQAAARVNATYIAHSRPGISLQEVLSRGQAAYAATGYPEEWHHHHQGGVTGYEPREYLATPQSSDRISEGQAVAWNPTVAGAKMEDTILVGSNYNEILTATTLWPIEEIEIPGQPGIVPCALALER